MIKYKILTFRYDQGAQGLYKPKDIDKELGNYIPHGAFNGMYNTSDYLHDNTGSVKSGAFSIHTIYLYKQDEPTTGVILSVGDEISNNRLMTIRRFIYDFDTNNIKIDINDSKYTKEKDIISLIDLSNFTKVRDILSNKIELFKELDIPKKSNNTNDNLFDLQEIEEVLDIFLDKPEVQSALVEFKEYKVKKNNNVLESIAKPEESEYVLPEKFYFRLNTDEKVKWINQYRNNGNYYGKEDINSNTRVAYPYYERSLGMNIHSFNIHEKLEKVSLLDYIDVDDKFHEVLKKYPLKDYNTEKPQPLPF